MASLYLPNKFPSQAAKTSSSMLFRYSSVLMFGVFFFYCAASKPKIPGLKKGLKKTVKFFGSGLQTGDGIQLGKKMNHGLCCLFFTEKLRKEESCPAQKDLTLQQTEVPVRVFMDGWHWGTEQNLSPFPIPDCFPQSLDLGASLCCPLKYRHKVGLDNMEQDGCLSSDSVDYCLCCSLSF